MTGVDLDAITLSNSTRPDSAWRIPFGPTVATAATNVAAAALGMGANIILARMLGPEKRGQLALVQLVVLTIQPIAAWGGGDALTYFVASGKAGSRDSMSAALRIALPASLLSSLVAMVAVAQWADGPMANGAMVYAATLVPLAVLEMTGALHRGSARHNAWNLVRIVTPAAWFAAVCTWILLGGPAATLYWVFGALCVLGAYLTLNKSISIHTLGGKDKVRPMLRYGLASAVVALASSFASRSDQMIVARMKDAAELGTYVVAINWSNIPYPILLAFGAPLFAKVAGLEVQNRRRFIQSALTQSLLAATVIAGGCALAAPFGIPFLFGPDYAKAIPAAMVMSVAGGVLGINRVLANVAYGIGRPWLVGLAETLRLGIIIALVPWLLRSSLTAAAAAVLVAGCAAGALLYREVSSSVAAKNH